MRLQCKNEGTRSLGGWFDLPATDEAMADEDFEPKRKHVLVQFRPLTLEDDTAENRSLENVSKEDAELLKKRYGSAVVAASNKKPKPPEEGQED